MIKLGENAKAPQKSATTHNKENEPKNNKPSVKFDDKAVEKADAKQAFTKINIETLRLPKKVAVTKIPTTSIRVSKSLRDSLQYFKSVKNCESIDDTVRYLLDLGMNQLTENQRKAIIELAEIDYETED